MPEISVITPIYKVEAFIERCARSLLEQSFNDVEFIFVDDSTPDSSIEILTKVIAEYPDRKVLILHHERNKGLPAARNTGMKVASGNYIYHCDSDDWVERDLLQKMHDAAVAHDADLVYCDFWLSFEKSERYMRNPQYDTIDDVVRKGYLQGAMKFNVWNKLVRRTIYTENDISFPEGHAMGEDMTMIRLGALCQTVTNVPEALYHYVKLNTAAYSKTQSEKNLADTLFNVALTADFLMSKDTDTYAKYVGFFKLNTKLPFLLTGRKEDYHRWHEWYPEANGLALSNHELPMRTRILQWMAAKRSWIGVKAYYLLIYKFVYGIIYR